VLFRSQERLRKIYLELKGLIARYKPDQISVERLFFGENSKTAMAVGQARGIVLLAAAEHGAPVTEFTPLEVKMALTGYGKAEKKQIQQMVKFLLKLPDIPKPDDAADALAVAICQLHSHKLTKIATPA
jgi:crossover junction endodeoxyribonuclease RuvC